MQQANSYILLCKLCPECIQTAQTWQQLGSKLHKHDNSLDTNCTNMTTAWIQTAQTWQQLGYKLHKHDNSLDPNCTNMTTAWIQTAQTWQQLGENIISFPSCRAKGRHLVIYVSCCCFDLSLWKFWRVINRTAGISDTQHFVWPKILSSRTHSGCQDGNQSESWRSTGQARAPSEAALLFLPPRPNQFQSTFRLTLSAYQKFFVRVRAAAAMFWGPFNYLFPILFFIVTNSAFLTLLLKYFSAHPPDMWHSMAGFEGPRLRAFACIVRETRL